MEGSKIGLLVSRVLLLIFGAVVLGVAARLAIDFDAFLDLCRALRDHGQSCDRYYEHLFDSPNPSIRYAAFTGAWGILAALITLVAVFVDAIPSVVTLAFDALASIFYLAGGINNAVQRSRDALFDSDNRSDTLLTRWDATTAFMFLGFIVSVAALVLVFLGRRSGGMRSSAV